MRRLASREAVTWEAVCRPGRDPLDITTVGRSSSSSSEARDAVASMAAASAPPGAVVSEEEGGGGGLATIQFCFVVLRRSVDFVVTVVPCLEISY